MATTNPAEMTDDELEAAQRAADGEPEGTTTDDITTTTETTQSTSTTTEQQPDTTPSQTTETAQGETTTEGTATTTAEAQTSAVAEGDKKPVGVASKDGQRILPYSALQAERRSARQASARAERAEREAETLRQEIEDLRAGKTKASTALTEEEVQRMEADFPEEGKKLRAAFERTKELEQQIAAAAPKDAPKDDEVGDDPVQEAIDQVPLLVEWQHDEAHADKWQRAIAIDNVLKDSPKWKDKPAVDRFERVAQMVAEEFDIELPQPKTGGTGSTSSTKQPQQQQQQSKAPDPKAAAKEAERQPPSTLSDLKGGAVPDHGQVDLNKMSPQRMLGRFMDMDDAEIDRQLAKLG